MFSKDQIKWRCRRGVLELDVILTRFLEQKYDGLSEDELKKFYALLELPDPLLQQWLIYGEMPDESFKKIVELILL